MGLQLLPGEVAELPRARRAPVAPRTWLWALAAGAALLTLIGWLNGAR